MFRALGILVGMIIGAGMFALPYTVVHAGLGWSLFYFVLAAVLVTLVHVYYAKVLLAYDGIHRLPGYVGEFFGRGAYALALAARFFSYFGYLLAYGVLGGIFLHELGFISLFGGTLIFFAAGALLLALDLRSAGIVNWWLTLLLVGFVFFLAFAALPHSSFQNIHFSPSRDSWFLPYGVFLFAFSGASAIQEVVDLLRKRKKILAKVIVGTTVLVALVYILFTASILGLTRGAVGEDAISSLKGNADRSLYRAGIVIGFLAVATSYIALALELRFTFSYDLSFAARTGWILVASVPPLLYLLHINNFIFIISLVGAVGVGLEGVFIMLLVLGALPRHRTPALFLMVLFLGGSLLGIADALGFLQK